MVSFLFVSWLDFYVLSLGNWFGEKVKSMDLRCYMPWLSWELWFSMLCMMGTNKEVLLT